MKSLIALTTVLALSTASASAADGQLSYRALAKMGLSGLKVMSDADGVSIRGASAQAGGFSVASVSGSGGASSLYYGSGGNLAAGFSASAAVKQTNNRVIFGAAGGYSAATSH
jgi:hypothetical protein